MNTESPNTAEADARSLIDSALLEISGLAQLAMDLVRKDQLSEHGAPFMLQTSRGLLGRIAGLSDLITELLGVEDMAPDLRQAECDRLADQLECRPHLDGV